MDKIIEKKKWTLKKIALIALAAGFVITVLFYIIFGDKSSKYNVQSDRLTIETVVEDYFQEYINVTGNVLPIRTVYLDAMEGGRVEEIFLEEGTIVKKGDTILRLSNTNLHLEIMNREASLSEQMNNLRNTRLSMEQNKLDLRKQLLEIDFLLVQKERDFEHSKKLYEKKFIAEEEFTNARNDYLYYKNKKDILIESQKQDSLFRDIQIEQLEESVTRMQENLGLVRNKLDNLNVKAPVDGQLASINAEYGEAINAGQRLGQVNILTSHKIQAEIDEHYISRITNQLVGDFDFSGSNYSLIVKKIYPEVRNGRFSIDMEFNKEIPNDLRIGQTFRIKLELGESQLAVLIPRGGFYQSTGGQYIFLVDKDNAMAVKRNIRLGRFNPKFYEVLEGLQPGEKVITSSYDTFGEVDKLVLKK